MRGWSSKGTHRLRAPRDASGRCYRVSAFFPPGFAFFVSCHERNGAGRAALDSPPAACHVTQPNSNGPQIMFEALVKFLSDVTEGDKHPSRFAENDYRLAAAALLVHAA